MTVRMTRGTAEGFETVVLENPLLRAVIVPSLGGRVWELEDRMRARQWIWHRPDVPLEKSPIGAVYDDVWAGGWEELFPNDAHGTFEGRQLPDHGEWWATPWSVKDPHGGDESDVTLSADLRIVRAHCTKQFRLARDRATLSVTYRIRSAEPAPFHFLFKQHLPIVLAAGCRLLLPGGTVEPVDASFGTMLPSSENFAWPHSRRGSRAVDLRLVPPATSELREFVYVRDLPDGWCGVEDPAAGASIRMRFDSEAFPYVWLFLTYGGWRGLHTAVLEPCTNMPKDLEEAVRLGQSAVLLPGQEFVTTVTVSLSGPCEAES
jgi:hypothetical protein